MNLPSAEAKLSPWRLEFRRLLEQRRQRGFRRRKFRHVDDFQLAHVVHRDRRRATRHFGDPGFVHLNARAVLEFLEPFAQLGVEPRLLKRLEIVAFVVAVVRGRGLPPRKQIGEVARLHIGNRASRNQSGQRQPVSRRTPVGGDRQGTDEKDTREQPEDASFHRRTFAPGGLCVRRNLNQRAGN
jgi:hypothetical protein